MTHELQTCDDGFARDISRDAAVIRQLRALLNEHGVDETIYNVASALLDEAAALKLDPNEQDTAEAWAEVGRAISGLMTAVREDEEFVFTPRR